MRIYKYSKGDATAKIENHNGAWILRISHPQKVVVLFNEIYPTKRAALKYASVVLNSLNN